MTKRTVHVLLAFVGLAVWVSALRFMVTHPDPANEPVWVKAVGMVSVLTIMVGVVVSLILIFAWVWHVTERPRAAIKEWYDALPDRRSN